MPSPLDLKCPHCAAKVGRNWRTCWLCGLELPANLAETSPAAAPPAREAGAAATFGKVAGLFLVIAIGLLIAGLVADDQYPAVVSFLVLLLPAGIVTLTKSLRSRSEGAPLSVLEKAGTFLLSVAVTVGALAAVGVALFIALFIACIGIVSTGGLDFR